MRFIELEGLSDSDAEILIEKCREVELNEAIENPNEYQEKIFVFLGNYDGFATNRLCARTFEYISTEGSWEVSDITVYDMFKTSFDKHFSKFDLRTKFKDFCDAKGFVMDV